MVPYSGTSAEAGNGELAGTMASSASLKPLSFIPGSGLAHFFLTGMKFSLSSLGDGRYQWNRRKEVAKLQE